MFMLARRETKQQLPVLLPNIPMVGNRLRFESFLRAHCEDTKVVRLPGLFGVGLKKNLIFDAINNKDLSGFHPESTFQWFDMTELGRVVALVMGKRLDNTRFGYRANHRMGGVRSGWPFGQWIKLRRCSRSI